MSPLWCKEVCLGNNQYWYCNVYTCAGDFWEGASPGDESQVPLCVFHSTHSWLGSRVLMFFSERRQGAAMSHDGPWGDHRDGLPGVHRLAGCTPVVLSANRNNCKTETIPEKGILRNGAADMWTYIITLSILIACKCVIFLLIRYFKTCF